MMIKRYGFYFYESLYSSDYGMQEEKHGEYVSYEDHERIVAEMQDKIDALIDEINSTNDHITGLLNKYT